MSLIRPTFAAQGFATGKQIWFTVYDNTGKLITKQLAQEWTGTGVYYSDVTVSFFWNKSFLVIAQEPDTNWLAFKVFSKQNRVRWF